MSEVEFLDRQGLSILAFDPSLLGLAVKPIGNGRFDPMTLSEVMRREDVLAAIDGSMFTNCDPGSNERTLECANPELAALDRSQGVLEQSDRGKGDQGISLWIVNGRARWTLGGSIDSEAAVGAQFYPSLVVNGRVSEVSTSGGNAHIVGRAAVLGLADGRVAFATGRDSLQGFARRCAAAGAVWAGYTDGGTSYSMGLREASGSFRRWGMSEANERPVAMFLVARRPVSKSIVTSSAAPWIIGTAAVVAIGLGVWALRRRAL